MSEPITDTGGRVWTFQGYATGSKKQWCAQLATGAPLEMIADESGWILALPSGEKIRTRETGIDKALRSVQARLDTFEIFPPVDPYLPSEEYVRAAFIDAHGSGGKEAFDRWLAKHDAELIATITSIKEAS